MDPSERPTKLQEVFDKWGQCHCSVEAAERYADLTYESKAGKHSVDIVLAFCADCGDPIYAHVSPNEKREETPNE